MSMALATATIFLSGWLGYLADARNWVTEPAAYWGFGMLCGFFIGVFV